MPSANAPRKSFWESMKLAWELPVFLKAWKDRFENLNGIGILSDFLAKASQLSFNGTNYLKNYFNLGSIYEYSSCFNA